MFFTRRCDTLCWLSPHTQAAELVALKYVVSLCKSNIFNTLYYVQTMQWKSLETQLVTLQIIIWIKILIIKKIINSNKSFIRRGKYPTKVTLKDIFDQKTTSFTIKPKKKRHRTLLKFSKKTSVDNKRPPNVYFGQCVVVKNQKKEKTAKYEQFFIQNLENLIFQNW